MSHMRAATKDASITKTGDAARPAAPDADGAGAAMGVVEGLTVSATPDTVMPVLANERLLFSEARNEVVWVPDVMDALVVDGLLVATVKATVMPLCSRWRPLPEVAVTLVMEIALGSTEMRVAMVAMNAVCAAPLNCCTLTPLRETAALRVVVVVGGGGGEDEATVGGGSGGGGALVVLVLLPLLVMDVHDANSGRVLYSCAIPTTVTTLPAAGAGVHVFP